MELHEFKALMRQRINDMLEDVHADRTTAFEYINMLSELKDMCI